MLKLLALLTLTAIIEAHVYEFISKATMIATFPPLTPTVACNPFTIKKVIGVKCTCGDKTDVPLFLLKYGQDHSDGAEEFTAIDMINGHADVETVNIRICKCGEEEYEYSVYKEINDNFGVYYTAAKLPNEPNTAYITVKTLPTKAVFESTIKQIPDLSSRTNYDLICDLS